MPSKFSSIGGQLTYILSVTSFFLAFIIAYRPTDMVDFFGMGGEMLTVNVVLLMCIVLGVMLLSRSAMLVFLRHEQKHKSDISATLRWLRFVLWCLFELVVASFFMALYITLMYMHTEYALPYFKAVGLCLGFLLSVEWSPYTIITLLLVVLSPKEESVMAESSPIRFLDKAHKLKFLAVAESVLYVKADENYVKIVYEEGGNVKTYDLRNSMKGVEQSLLQHGLLRCHRSYFVNPQHIKTVRRTKEGLVLADINIDGCPPVPISSTYQKSLSDKLLNI